jgi:Response regulator containing a CheY-like receiver domain and an HTH DNA-binding domain
MNPIRVALVDDHSIVRRGLSAYFAAQPDITIVGEAASGEEALRHAATWQADVIVMDVLMPGGIDGIETTRRLKRLLPQTQIIILSGYADDARVIGALRAGPITYVEKDSQPEQLLEAVRGAAQGKAIFEPALMQRILQAQTMRSSDALTEREGEVLKLLAEGLTNAESPRACRSAKRRSRRTSPASCANSAWRTAHRRRSMPCDMGGCRGKGGGSLLSNYFYKKKALCNTKCSTL